VRFVCDVSAELGTRVMFALNPVTKTEIRLSPPFSWTEKEDLDMFVQNFELYCQVTWHFGRLDPTEVNVSRWPRTLPPGFSPVDFSDPDVAEVSSSSSNDD